MKDRFDTKTENDIKEIIDAKEYDRLDDYELIKASEIFFGDLVPKSYVQYMASRLKMYVDEITGG